MQYPSGSDFGAQSRATKTQMSQFSFENRESHSWFLYCAAFAVPEHYSCTFQLGVTVLAVQQYQHQCRI